MPSETSSTQTTTSHGKLEKSLRKLQALDRILASPKLSEKGKKRLTHARNIQRNVVKLRRKALSANPPPN